MPSFILRKIDTALWQAFRDKAFASGSTPKAVLLQFIALYADDELRDLIDHARGHEMSPHALRAWIDTVSDLLDARILPSRYDMPDI